MIRGRIGGSLAISLGAFAVAAVVLPRPYLFDLVNGMAIAFSVAVTVRYWIGLVDFFRAVLFARPLEPGHLLITGSVLILIAFAGRTVWIEVWRQTYDGGHGSLDHVAFGFLAWLLVPACLLALAGPRLWRVTHARKEGPTVAVAVAGGILLSLAFAAWRLYFPLR